MDGELKIRGLKMGIFLFKIVIFVFPENKNMKILMKKKIGP
jgi:hypothetical protein